MTHDDRDKPEKPEDKKIELEFVTTAGDLKGSFPANEPLKAVKLQVMQKVGLDPSQAEQFAVLRDGTELDENKKLSQLDLTDGTVLFIERREVVKV